MARKAKKAARKSPGEESIREEGRSGRVKPVRVTATAGKTVTASALLQSVADHLGMKKTEAKALTEGYLDVVKAYVMKGAKVKIGDIGMIMIRARKARMGRNPQTGEPVKIKASKKLAFRESSVMKAQVMGGR